VKRRRWGRSREERNGSFHVVVMASLLMLAKAMVVVSGKGGKEVGKWGDAGRHAFIEYAAQREHHCTLDRDKAGMDRAYFQVVDQMIRGT